MLPKRSVPTAIRKVISSECVQSHERTDPRATAAVVMTRTKLTSVMTREILRLDTPATNGAVTTVIAITVDLKDPRTTTEAATIVSIQDTLLETVQNHAQSDADPMRWSTRELSTNRNMISM